MQQKTALGEKIDGKIMIFLSELSVPGDDERNVNSSGSEKLVFRSECLPRVGLLLY